MKRLNILLYGCLFLGFFFAISTTKAQLHVNSSGNIGIGTNSPSGRVYIDNSAQYRTIYANNTYNGASTKYGLVLNVSADGTGSHYGLDNTSYSNGSSTYHFGLRNTSYIFSADNGFGINNTTYCQDGEGDRWGIYNYLSCSTACGAGDKIALYSGIWSGCGGYAGYFSGNVHVLGTITSTSDAGKKTNIQELAGAMSLISLLKPKTYNFVEDADLNLPREKQFGFLAQDLEQVFPELVKSVPVVGQSAPDKNGETQPVINGDMKAVNYIGLIPILVQGMQEQQKTIEAQQKRITELEAKINR